MSCIHVDVQLELLLLKLKKRFPKKFSSTFSLWAKTRRRWGIFRRDAHTSCRLETRFQISTNVGNDFSRLISNKESLEDAGDAGLESVMFGTQIALQMYQHIHNFLPSTECGSKPSLFEPKFLSTPSWAISQYALRSKTTLCFSFLEECSRCQFFNVKTPSENQSYIEPAGRWWRKTIGYRDIAESSGCEFYTCWSYWLNKSNSFSL